MMRFSGRVAFERFWYARGPMLMVSMAYGITLVLAALTFSNLGDSPALSPNGKAGTAPTKAARLLAPALHAQAAPVLPAALAQKSVISACP
ncbi:hypothetical protein QMO56_20685 [Roseomonas sp. E05]|uniref:hypothetical protein n=1 Tax=Roseomonas sp. E05 TaxID=3046310 RepID=UPI0024B87A83|nr:hypothetical protein [Roseomonas sp. E05]MDJ0390533.1 hypothetical protein [Roseomonas sp. E05]